MALTLREVLDHPLLVEAEPQLVSGADRLDRPVRWVHSADLYDIAPLLRGDEVLLTNGVGLLGVDDEARRTYVRRLAQRGVAALLFEVGRTFPDLPDGMAEEAARLTLPLVVLQPVLRFTEVAEAVNSLLIDRSVSRLRHADEISRSLSEVLARSGSLPDLLERIGEVAGTWAVLLDDVDQEVAAAGTRPDGAAAASAPLLVDGTSWGRFAIGADGVAADLRDALLERAPPVLALALVRHRPTLAGSLRLKQALVAQLLEGRQVEENVLRDQLRACGMPLHGHPYACVVVDRARFPAAVDALEHVLARHHPGIVGVADAVACAVLTGGAGEAPAEFSRSVRAELSAALGVRGATCAAIGPTATGHMGLPHSMSEARLSLLVAQQQQVEDTVVAAQGLAVERLLHRYGDRAELRQYVDEQLGRLLQHDARRGSTLVATLDAFLTCGGSKAAAAVRLHLRRQSLYYRLRQIDELVEADLDDPRDRTALAVALAALRLIGGTR